MDERWKLVEKTLNEDARLIAWDGCHKIYIAMDDIEAEWFRDCFYTVVEGSTEHMLSMLHAWWDNSCGLRLINAVRHVEENPNDGYTDLLPQFCDAEDFDQEDDISDIGL